VGNRIEQSRSIERPNVLEDTNHRRTFKPSFNCAPHGALKRKVGFSRRPHRIVAAQIVLSDRRRSVAIFRGELFDAPIE
jgi:hypothetical protein